MSGRLFILLILTATPLYAGDLSAPSAALPYYIFLTTLSLSVSIYYLLVGVSLFRKEPIYLYFSFYTLVCSIYYMLSSVMPSFGMSSPAAEDLIFTFMPILSAEALRLYFGKRRNAFFHAFSSLTIAAALVVLLSGNSIVHHAIYILWLPALGFLFYIKIVKRRENRRGSCLLFSFSIWGILIAAELALNITGVDTFRFSTFGYILFLASAMMMLRNRFVTFHHKAEKKPSAIKLTSEKESVVEEIASFIEENFSEPLTRENIGEEFSIHPEVAGKLFKKIKGITLNEHLNRVRVAQACRMLEESDASVTKIAFDCGFESLATFYRIFQKEMKISPTEFRNRR